MTFWRIGSCRRCGKCCQTNTLLSHIKEELEKLGLRQDAVCPHLKHNLDGTTTCLIYPRRPKFCREFPGSPADIAGLPDCGYRFIDERGRVVAVR